jgi:hypothetical protein
MKPFPAKLSKFSEKGMGPLAWAAGGELRQRDNTINRTDGVKMWTFESTKKPLPLITGNRVAAVWTDRRWQAIRTIIFPPSLQNL